MSNFNYGNHTDKHIGIWLRPGSNEDLLDLIKKSKQKRFFDTVMRIIVVEQDKETKQVYLQIWCNSIIDSIRGKLRYNVFHIKTKINPNWVCEGDLGSGVNF